MNGDIGAFVEALKGRSGKNIWLVGGSELIEGFMEAGEVDEFMIGVIPVLIGGGIPLFRKNEPGAAGAEKPLPLRQLRDAHYEVLR